jgi:hypothetical protein
MESPLPQAPTSAPLPPEVPTFAAFVNSGMLPSVSEDTEEYLGWIVIDENLQTSVNWGDQTKVNMPTVMQAVSISTLPPKQQAPISCNKNPFWLDTGATVYISPNADDFYLLRKVTLHIVQGLGGSPVTAVGIGDVHICIGRGAHLNLKDVLYIPTATIRLISVRCLTCNS